MGSQQQYSIKDEPIENLRPLKVRVIGAGYSGIYLGIRIPQRLRNVDLQIYEKNEGIGGTWWANRYPGCACDVPSHSYQFSFDPNPDWSAVYAPAAEIRAYLERMVDKYGVMRYVKLSHNITNCRWDDEAKKWNITVENTSTGQTFEDDADVLLSARGNFSDYSWPDTPGLNTFGGELMHSAAWNQKYDFTNKTVGVIGGGSSAIQIVPKLQKIEGLHLTCFVRNKTWIADPFGDNVMRKFGMDPKKFEFSPEQRKEFASDPEKLLNFRKAIEIDGNTIHAATMQGTDLQNGAVKACRALMKERLGKKPEVADFLIPSFGVGCRRTTPGPGYLEALIENNVDFVSEDIASITPKGVVLPSGKTVEIDALVCATGFRTASAPLFPLCGKSGISLQDKFSPYPQTYLAVAVDGFPNFFMMFGPNSAIGAGALTTMIEAQGDYIVKCIRKLQKEDYCSMTPKPERVKDFSEYCGEYFKKTVYMDKCKSWYKNEGGKGNHISGLWPGSNLHCLETLRSPRWEDYDYETRDENKLRWLGNGWSATQMEGGWDPAWYVDPDMIKFPLPGHPEEDEEYKRRPFSH